MCVCVCVCVCVLQQFMVITISLGGLVTDQMRYKFGMLNICDRDIL